MFLKRTLEHIVGENFFSPDIMNILIFFFLGRDHFQEDDLMSIILSTLNGFDSITVRPLHNPILTFSL